jgi:hypothetical protein
VAPFRQSAWISQDTNNRKPQNSVPHNRKRPTTQNIFQFLGQHPIIHSLWSQKKVDTSIPLPQPDDDDRRRRTKLISNHIIPQTTTERKHISSHSLKMFSNQNVPKKGSHKREILFLDVHNLEASSTKILKRTRRSTRPMTMKIAIPGNSMPDDHCSPSRKRSRRVSRQMTLTHILMLQLLLLSFLFQPVDALLNLRSQKKIRPTTTTTTPLAAASIGRLMLLRAAPTSEEVRLRLFKELERLREKDRQTRLLRPMVRVVDRTCWGVHTYLPHGEGEEKHQSCVMVDPWWPF